MYDKLISGLTSTLSLLDPDLSLLTDLSLHGTADLRARVDWDLRASTEGTGDLRASGAVNHRASGDRVPQG